MPKGRKSKARLARRIKAFEATRHVGTDGTKLWVHPPAKQGGNFHYHRPGSNKK